MVKSDSVFYYKDYDFYNQIGITKLEKESIFYPRFSEEKKGDTITLKFYNADKKLLLTHFFYKTKNCTNYKLVDNAKLIGSLYRIPKENWYVFEKAYIFNGSFIRLLFRNRLKKIQYNKNADLFAVIVENKDSIFYSRYESEKLGFDYDFLNFERKLKKIKRIQCILKKSRLVDTLILEKRYCDSNFICERDIEYSKIDLGLYATSSDFFFFNYSLEYFDLKYSRY